MNRGIVADSVLKLIPYDKWVSAREISKKTDISGHKVSGIIKSHLLNKFVERSKFRTKSGKSFKYKRIKFIVGKMK